VSTFSRNDVLRLARLARLELSEDEVELFGRQLGDILAFARQIQSVDTASVADAPPGPSGAGLLRDDTVCDSLDRDRTLSAAPAADRETGLIKVPRVFNG
jgi:aspartyl-tRNA(Asn)/glutamyl-tRNA(Gln) amidotransferase subunit C